MSNNQSVSLENSSFNSEAFGGGPEKRARQEQLLSWINAEIHFLPADTHLEGIPDTVAPSWPNCCDWHRTLSKSIDDYIEKFPHCCEPHANLDPPPSWFKKDQWIGNFREKVLNTCRQTENLWNAKIGELDWYEHITEFVEYAMYSFGQLPKGYGSPVGIHIYLNLLKGHIENLEEKDHEKAVKLQAFMDGWYSKKGPVPGTDGRVLLEKYSNWLDIFPWQISYLAPLKGYFMSHLPLLEGTPKVNRYSGLAKAQMITVEKLMTYIVQATTLILSTVNAQVLHEKNQLTDPEKKEIEVISARRRHELHQLGQNAKDERIQVNRILKQWFSGEQRYLRDMKPFWGKMEKRCAEQQAPGIAADFNFDKMDNMFCAKMPLSIALSHFEKLTKRNARNGKPFFTADQLNFFIARAFGRRTEIPPQRLNYGRGDNRLIISLFAEFAAMASRQFESSGHTKLKYVKLLCENIEGFTEKKVGENFRIIKGAWD